MFYSLERVNRYLSHIFQIAFSIWVMIRIIINKTQCQIICLGKHFLIDCHKNILVYVEALFYDLFFLTHATYLFDHLTLAYVRMRTEIYLCFFFAFILHLVAWHPSEMHFVFIIVTVSILHTNITSYFYYGK